MDYEQEYSQALALVERELSGCFLAEGPNRELLDAMRYSLLAGGKRVRPVLVLKFCEAACGEMEPALDYACAVEMLHTYSLIHDDLPCMDNDELRRGKPTCHMKYGEWLALLAGDALQAAAFERLALSSRTTPQANAKACEVLAVAAGRHNMCAGQYLDIVEEGKALDADRLTQIHLRKTSALLGAACLLGLTASPVEPTEKQWAAALDYAKELGLAFQIRDDMLDVESTAEELGKPIGSDADNGKTTFASLYGLEKCAELVSEHTRRAQESIAGVFEHTDFLCALARFMAVRKH
jgi:geranylgeranyl pyrophosphate synthase